MQLLQGISDARIARRKKVAKMAVPSGSVEIDLDSMMDVVAMYKCRFCSYTSEAQSVMKDHLTGHVVASGTTQMIQGEIQDEQITEVDAGLFDSDHSTITETNISEDILTNNSQTLLLEDLAQCDGTILTLKNEPGRNTSSINTIASANTVMATRELFLCGQCNSGFESMDDCKVHIEQDHQLVLSVEASAEAPFVTYANPSVGTQADGDAMLLWKQGKKRGRKKKGERGQEEKETFDEELAKQLFDDGDDDYRVTTACTRSAGKRKIRPPTSLFKEYFIGVDNNVNQSCNDVKQEAKESSQPNSSFTSPEKVTESDSQDTSNINNANDTHILKEVCSATKRRKTKPVDLMLFRDDDGDETYIPSEREETEANEEENGNANISQDSDLNENTCGDDELVNNKQTTDTNSAHVQEQATGTLPKRKKRKIERAVYVEKVQRMKVKYKCLKDFCKGKFNRKASYEMHKQCHNKQRGLVCFQCGEKFKFWPPCSLHLWKNHQIDLDLYCCDQCDFRTNLACKLGIHKAIHSEVRPYVCKVCNRGFKQSSQLINHEGLHSNFGPNFEVHMSKKICSLCDKSFSTENTLRTHINVVHGRTKFACPTCDHCATSKAALVTHIRTHTGEKPFKCDFCAFSSGDMNTLRRHRMRHTGDKPYVCQYCGYSCIQSASFKSHIKTRHGEGASGVWCCELCSFHTISEKRWLSHLADHNDGRVRVIRPQHPTHAMKQQLGAVCDPSSGKPIGKFVVSKYNSLQQVLEVLGKARLKCTTCSFSTADMPSMLSHIATANHKPSNNTVDFPAQISTASMVPTTSQSIVMEPVNHLSAPPSGTLSDAVNQTFSITGLVDRDLSLNKYTPTTPETTQDSTDHKGKIQMLIARKLPNGKVIYELSSDKSKCVNLIQVEKSPVIGMNPLTQLQQKQCTAIKAENRELFESGGSAIERELPVKEKQEPHDVITKAPVANTTNNIGLKTVVDESVIAKSDRSSEQFTENVHVLVETVSESHDGSGVENNVSVAGCQSDVVGCQSDVVTVTGYVAGCQSDVVTVTGPVAGSRGVDQSCEVISTSDQVHITEDPANQYVYSMNEEGNVVITVLPNDSQGLIIDEEGFSQDSQTRVITQGHSESQPFILTEEGTVLLNESVHCAESNEPQTRVFLEDGKLSHGFSGDSNISDTQCFVFSDDSASKLCAESRSFMCAAGGASLQPVSMNDLSYGQIVLTQVDSMDCSMDNLQVVDLVTQEEVATS